MPDPREDHVAAPPDAGGHMGSKSPPQDTLQVQSTDPQQRQANPPLHRDVPQGRESWRGAFWAFIVIALLVLGFIAVTGYWPF